MKYIFLGIIFMITSGCASSNYYYQNGEKKVITPLNNKQRSQNNMLFFKNKEGIELGVSDSILVKFLNTSNLDFYIQKYKLTLVKELSKNLYEFKVENKSLTLDIANKLYEQNDIKYAHPNFYKKRFKR